MTENEKPKRNRPYQRSEDSEIPSQVFPHLYLGGSTDLADQKLKAVSITHILNATTTLDKPATISTDNFMRVPVLDSMSEVILGFLESCCEYIEQRRKQNQRVLLHCVAGISRSATIAIAYTMKHMGLNVHEAYQYVKKCRPQISPNIAFMGQLIEYQNIINGAKTKEAEKPETQSAILPQRILPPVVVNKDTQPKVAPKDRSGLRLSLDLNRKRKRSSDIPSVPVRSKKRPTLLLLSSTTTNPAPLPGPSGIFPGPSSAPKCAKMISKSDPISSPHKLEMFAAKNAVRKVNSDSDLDKVNQNQPLKFSARIRHGSAGEFNESD